MKRILIVLLTLVFAQASSAVLVDGYCYLEGKADYSGTKVKFIEDSPSAVTDSTYTDASGYFNIDLVPGIYNVEYSHADYFTMTRNDEVLTSNTTLPPTYLELSTGLSGPLSGVLGPGYYRVAGGISIESGDSLQIEPGTTLRFDGTDWQYEFTIRGILLAEGTEEDSIFFTTDTNFGPEWRSRLRFTGETSSGSWLAYCVIRKGWANNGGGVCCSYSSPTFTNCTLTENLAYDDGGGGVYCDHGSPSFSNCVISANSATGGSVDGGGAYCYNSSPSFTNCTFGGNSASDDGGGAYCNSFSPTFTNCTFSGNSADNDGGGAYCSGGLPTFTNCIISSNSAVLGAGVYCHFNSSAIFKNCMINKNEANYSAGVYIRDSSPTFNSTIIAFSIGSGILFFNSEESHVEYCDIFGNSGGDIAFYNDDPSQGPPAIGELLVTNANGDFCDIYMNIFLDPLFVDTVASDFHLGDYSPCIGAADPTNPPATDMDGNPRPNPPGSLPDIGAFEHWRDVPLPVEMTTFQAVAGEGQVILRWQTASELNNSHFVLYKRRAGQETFQVLTQISGYGTTSEPHDYEFIDRWVQNSTTYEYQISDVDLAGHETFHQQIVTATPDRNATPFEFALYPNWPNPFNPTTTIRYDVEEAGLVSLKVFDLLGREVATLTHEEHSAGIYSVTWDADGMPSGVYLCRMDTEGFVQTRKMVLVK